MKFTDLFKQFSHYWRFAKKYKISIITTVVFAVIIELANLGEKFMYKFFIDDATAYLPDQAALFISSAIVILITYASLLAGKSILIWLRIHIQNIFVNKMQKDVKKTFYEHILNLSYDFHTTHKSGMLISRLDRGANACDSVTESVFQATIPLILQIIFVLAAVGALHIYFTFIILIGVFLLIGSNFIIQALQLNARRETTQAEDDESAQISDTFTNVETIKYFGKESYMQSQFSDVTTNTQKKTLKWEQYFRFLQVINDTLPGAIFVILFATSIHLLTNQLITVGDVVFVQATFLGMIGPMRYFMWMFRALNTGLIDFESLTNYLDVKPDVVDKQNVKLKITDGDVQFKNMNFGYNSKKVFEDFTLNIKPGEKVALVGHSGSGKSTLVKLLYRLYDIQSGDILIDSQPISQVTQQSLRQSLSIVPQEGILFDDTLYNNVKFVNQEATKEQIMEAFKDAQLTNIITKLEKKEHTIVGERGVRLSGGERQRVAIARALIANTKILILDEATSALDSQTEKHIQTALSRLLKKKTAIIIAHRLSTIMNADKIVVLENGKIVQMGKHEELIKTKGPYYELWNLQKGGYIE